MRSMAHRTWCGVLVSACWHGGALWYFARGCMLAPVFLFFCNQIKFDLIASAGHPPADRIKRERVRITMQAGDIACTRYPHEEGKSLSPTMPLPDRNRKAALHRVGTQCSSTCPWTVTRSTFDACWEAGLKERWPALD